MTTIVTPAMPLAAVEAEINRLQTEMLMIKNKIAPLEQARAEIRERAFLYELAQLCNKHRMWVNCGSDDDMWASEMQPGQTATPENVLENR